MSGSRSRKPRPSRCRVVLAVPDAFQFSEPGTVRKPGTGRLVATVLNKGTHAITRLEAQLSPDGKNLVPPRMTKYLSLVPDVVLENATGHDGCSAGTPACSSPVTSWRRAICPRRTRSCSGPTGSGSAGSTGKARSAGSLTVASFSTAAVRRGFLMASGARRASRPGPG